MMENEIMTLIFCSLLTFVIGLVLGQTISHKNAWIILEQISRWGTIHIKQPISPLHHINKQDSKVIVLEETIQKLRLDLGVGGSDLAYKLNFLDIAL